MADILTAENIFISFSGRKILDGVSISARKGEITGLLGRNGCGKSTMLKIIFGTQVATDKNIHINGRHVKHAYAHKGLLNYLPQFSFFPPTLKVEKAAKEFEVDVSNILGDFPELREDIGKTFSKLSGGKERLWSVLILLLAKTAFTLLDEPFTHIMPLHIDALKRVLLREKQNKGIILTDHMYRPLLEISDRIYLIKESKSYFIRNLPDLSLHGYVRENAFD